MAFCINCGKSIVDGSKFCPNCGVSQSMTANNTQRKFEWAGTIIKCPSCGEDIPSFTAICPSCGHEFNSAKVSSVLKEFINNINECDRLIATDSSKTGWASWGKFKRFWWVVLNIFTSCLPIIIYLITPLIRYNNTPRLTPEEKRKASLIENFPFPNEREALLEALLFVKSKISYLAAEKVDKKNAYWTRLWSAKGEQLYQRAEILFEGDEIANTAYREIIAQKLRVSKAVKFKATSGIIILLAIIILALLRDGTFNSILVQHKPLIIPDTELSRLIPPIDGAKGTVVVNNSSYFTIECYGISNEEFENYKYICKNSGFTIDCESTGSLFDAYNEDGYNIRITYYNSEMDIHITNKMDMNNFVWPDSQIAALVPVPKSNYGNISSSSETCLIVYIGNTTVEDYKEYIYACMEKGFDNNISQREFSYHADNDDGFEIIVEYRGYNTMFLRIDD